MSTDRRTFLKLLGVPAIGRRRCQRISRSCSRCEAQGRSGTIADIEHIVILMQENRSFDHYFGTMRGVRGFADPRVMKMPSGSPCGGSRTAPAMCCRSGRPSRMSGMTFLSDPPHGWIDGHNAWHDGKYDQWIANKGITTMTYSPSSRSAVSPRASRCVHDLRRLSLLHHGANRPEPLSHVQRFGRQ